MSAGYFPKREKLDIHGLWRGLITASHILHSHGILDAYGHISVRNPDNHETFFMSRSMAPALVRNASDIVEYNIEDASPVESSAPKGFIERFIHSEIYKRFPSMNCVIHSHCREVLPYTISDVPLKAVVHMAGFLGNKVPVWDIASTYPTFGTSDSHDLLVRTASIGNSLAAEFKPSTSAGFIFSQMKSALPSIGGKSSDSAPAPTHSVVLMRGHGFTTCAEGIENAVFQAIYTKENAIVQTTALTLQNTHTGGTVDGKVEGSVDVEGSGKIKDGKVKSGKIKNESDIHALSDKEFPDAAKLARGSDLRPWPLWCREIEVNPLYINDCPSDE